MLRIVFIAGKREKICENIFFYENTFSFSRAHIRVYMCADTIYVSGNGRNRGGKCANFGGFFSGIRSCLAETGNFLRKTP